MLEAFLRYINEKQLFDGTQRLLLAVSGGLDSVVLVRLCFEAKLHFDIAHCNFQLRGDESDQDAVFVRALAQQHGTGFYEQRFDTKVFAQTNGVSTQMAARTLRYEWFEQIRTQHGYDYLLTAHHQDDLLETILINLTRGTGLAGLHGILPKNGTTVRPLLFATRAQIQQYASQHDLSWREDSSNATTDYVRNRLRHEVVPVLRDINPQVAAAAGELAERVAASEYILQEANAQVAQKVITQTDNYLKINYETLTQYAYSVERLAQWLAPLGFGYADTKRIWAQRDAAVGKQFLSSTHLLVKDRGAWVVTPRQAPSRAREVLFESKSVELDGLQLDWELVNEPDFNAPPDIAYLDADTLTWPLTLRPWREGDWFCPLGMKGKKQKVSDFLVNIKHPRNLKASVYVLENQGEITWIAGLRIDDRYKIKKNTKNILKFLINSNS
jgi:tRNA(Ile)-lysidine synthase